MADILQYHRDWIVWLDETGCDHRTNIRKFGYSLRGLPPVYHRFLIRGTRISAISALCTEGMVDYELVSGSVKGDTSLDFV